MTVEVPIAVLRAFGEHAYQHAGLSEDDARVAVEVQLASDLRGVDTHGFQRLPWYVSHLEKGDNNPRPRYEVVRSSPVHVLLDTDNALGQLGCVRLMELTLEKARQTGLAVGASRNSNDWGCGAYYPLMAAREGFVSFATTTSVPTIAPFGSRSRLIGNNPMVYAVPRRDAEPIVLDMALTPVALGKVMRARAEGEPIPVEWGFLDNDGNPTTHPVAALRGIIPAIGGYKGTGLSTMMNVLAGVLPGGFHTDEVNVGKRGQLFWVVSPELFQEREAFYDAVETMAGKLKAADPLPNREVFLPGELEQIRARDTMRRGTIVYPPSVLAELREMGDRLGLDVPAELTVTT